MKRTGATVLKDYQSYKIGQATLDRTRVWYGGGNRLFQYKNGQYVAFGLSTDTYYVYKGQPVARNGEVTIDYDTYYYTPSKYSAGVLQVNKAVLKTKKVNVLMEKTT